ncbi:MAG TPA: metallophosphoesterase [Jatrophihabitans sp.]|jgi:hypothetical protein
MRQRSGRVGKLGLCAVAAAVLLGGCAFVPAAAGRVTRGKDASGRIAARAVVVVAAGDIACKPGSRVTRTRCHQMGVARLIGRLHPRALLALGDLAYPAGTQPAFDHAYGPSWGRFKSITHPVPGNHEYGTPGAAGYYGYFGPRATPLRPHCRIWCPGHYSLRIGSWHAVALVTNCDEPEGNCRWIPSQTAWLRRDLNRHRFRCTVAYMKNPLFSGGFGATPQVRPLWRVLQAHGVDLVLTGHAHNYQRFVRLTPSGRRSAHGITEIIAGTGGDRLFTLARTRHQAARINHRFGVMRLALGRGHWTSEFVTERGHVMDRARGTCH